MERVNRELGKFFRIFVKNNHTAWACYVPLIQKIINETCHDSAEMTSHELHFNKKPVRPWTKWIKKPVVQGEDKNHEEKIELAAERIRKRGAARKKTHDEKHHEPFRKFKVGEEVLLWANNVSDNEKREIAKFFSKYGGPYTIKRLVGKATYILENENHEERGQFHTPDLLLYK